MAKISPCFKNTFVVFNSIFAIFGVVLFAFGLFLHQFAEEANALYAVISLYVIGSIIFAVAVLGAYGAHKESKCALIVFFILMCLATIGMLRVAIPIAVSRVQILSIIQEQLNTETPLSKSMEHGLDPIQSYLHCCGINSYTDWQGNVPESCDCVDPDAKFDTCEMITSRSSYSSIFTADSRSESRRIWSKPCGPVIITYMDKIMTIMMAVFFGLAALAILGGLMSLIMIIRVSAAPLTQLPSFPLSYQPPKYSEVVNC